MQLTTALRSLPFACLLSIAAAGAAAAAAPTDSVAMPVDSLAMRTAHVETRADSVAVHADGLLAPAGRSAPQRRHGGAGADTSRSLPRWLRPWLDFGGGWMATPSWLRPNYESSQGFGVGLEARPHTRWALRAGLEYQMLQARHDGNLILVTSGFGGTAFADTVPVHFATTAWQLALGGEFGVRALGDVWLTGGGGVGYMRTGFEDLWGLSVPDLELAVPAALRSGFGPTWTAAARYEFEPAPDVALGLEVRTTALRRGGEDVRLWLVRLCYRVPSRPVGRGHEPGGRGRR